MLRAKSKCVRDSRSWAELLEQEYVAPTDVNGGVLKLFLERESLRPFRMVGIGVSQLRVVNMLFARSIQTFMATCACTSEVDAKGARWTKAAAKLLCQSTLSDGRVPSWLHVSEGGCGPF